LIPNGEPDRRYPEGSSERDFFEAFERGIPAALHWYRDVRRATKREDQEDGVDAFIVTDIGEIPIQIKSSRSGIRGYRWKRPESQAIIVVVRRGERPKRIREKVFRKVSKRRFDMILRNHRTARV
jgi:hypothetical protein